MHLLVLIALLVPSAFSLKSISVKNVIFDPNFKPPPPKEDDYVDKFCRNVNDAMSSVVIKPVKDYVNLQGEKQLDDFAKLMSPPQYPPLSRGVSLVILGSVPTLLGWYGYYKFSVEEELYQQELRESGRVTGCGGFGTLLPFVFCVIIGTPLSISPFFIGEIGRSILGFGGLWILLGQVNLYRRVNELCLSSPTIKAEPLHAWWAILPPPLDVVVGLRQVHYLAKYMAELRSEPFPEDPVANAFPFIQSERFTLKEFINEPKRWFNFPFCTTAEWKNFDFKFLEFLPGP